MKGFAGGGRIGVVRAMGRFGGRSNDGNLAQTLSPRTADRPVDLVWKWTDKLDYTVARTLSIPAETVIGRSPHSYYNGSVDKGAPAVPRLGPDACTTERRCLAFARMKNDGVAGGERRKPFGVSDPHSVRVGREQKRNSTYVTPSP